MNENNVPDAELLIASGCAHCPAVLAGLTDLVKKGAIGRLEVINIARHPEAAEQRGVRGVPWVRIGAFELSGAQTPRELADWAARAGDPDGMKAYLLEQLQGGELGMVIAACRRSPQLLPQLLALAADLETPFAVRIGITAVAEDLGPEGHLADLVPAIGALAGSPHVQVRADAAHLLGLSGDPAARAPLERLAQDENSEVREIAGESLAQLAAERD